MKQKTIVDLITSVCLIIIGAVVLLFPLLKIINVRIIFLAILAFYGMINAVKFILTSRTRDNEGLFTSIASILTLILLGLSNIGENPSNLAFVLFFWIVVMSFIKLKKCDYYHDRHRKIFMLKIITLVLFVLSGLLTVINLYYEAEVQILVLGFFFFIHGILELVDPITNYLIDTKK